MFLPPCFAKNSDARLSGGFPWAKSGGHGLPTDEKLAYAVSWNSVSLGNASLETRDSKGIGGRKTCSALLRIRTNPALSSFFDLNAVFESSFDEKSKASLKFKSKMEQNGQATEEIVVFDPIKQTYELQRFREVKKGSIEKDTQDVLALIYGIRNSALKPGSVYDLKVYSGGKSYQLVARVLGREKIKIRLGEFNCFVVELFLARAQELELDGKMLIWISDDKKRLPCYFKIDCSAGLIVAELEHVTTRRGEMLGGKK
jgi:hypothetical protein